MLPQISALSTRSMNYLRKPEFVSLASNSLLLITVDGILSRLTSILATRQTDAFLAGSPEAS